MRGKPMAPDPIKIDQTMRCWKRKWSKKDWTEPTFEVLLLCICSAYARPSNVTCILCVRRNSVIVKIETNVNARTDPFNVERLDGKSLASLEFP
jgi:hypothetical protein